MASSDRPKIFISYSSSDRKLADQLRKHLAGRGQPGIFMDQQVEAGEDLQEAITSGLDKSDVVILLISPAFLQSQWNAYEAGVALAKERSGQGKVIPILVGDVDPASLPGSLRRVAALDGRGMDNRHVLSQLDEMLSKAAA